MLEKDKKYELVKTDTIKVRGVKLYRIRALKSFGDVKEGELGGYIESESNLSQYAKCWVGDKARVYDNARVYGNAQVFGNAKVYDNAKVFYNARVYGDDKIVDIIRYDYDTDMNKRKKISKGT